MRLIETIPGRNLSVGRGREGDRRVAGEARDEKAENFLSKSIIAVQNLGRIASYTDFIAEMEAVFSECLRVLKPGRKLCVITANVNQHTDHGLLTFPLSTDLATAMREVGLVMINEIIWSKDGTGGRWGSANGQRPIFGSYPYPPNFLFKNVHEYILIFSKPATKRTKGAKVKSYGDLMARTGPLILAAE